MAAWQIQAFFRQTPYRSIWVILGSAIVCYGVERLVLSLLRIGTNVSPLNPVAGIALALMLLYGPTALVGALLASLWIGKIQGMPWEALIGSALGTGIATGLGYWFLRKLHVSPAIHRVRAVILFILFGALLPSILNATITTLSSSFGQVVPIPILGRYWWELWRSDSLGVLCAAPPLLVLNHGQPLNVRWFTTHLHPRQLRRLIQPRTWAIGLWLIAVALSTWVAITRDQIGLPWLDYLPFFCLAWAVARFGQRGSVWSGALMVGMAAWFALQGQGLFFDRGGNIALSLTGFQSWSAVILATSLVSGAAIQERQSQIEQLRQPQHHPRPTQTNAEFERLLHEVSNQIRQSLDIEQILQHTVEAVRHLLQADRVCIFTTNAAGEGYIQAESVADAWPSMADIKIPPDVVVTMQQLYQTERIQVRDHAALVQQSPQFLKTAYTQYQVQASLTTSLEQNGLPFGLLVIHQCRGPRQWQPTEIDLIERLAPQIEFAIQQGNLYQDVQNHARQMEAEVAEHTAELRQTMTEQMHHDQVRQQLIHAVSHDLRTPMLGMLMVLQKLAMQSGDRISLAKPVLDRMLESSQRQVDLIQALLDDYAEMPDDRFQPNPQRLSCHSLIAAALNQLQPDIQKFQGQIDNQVSLKLPDIIGDAAYLQRVLENLILNALQHNPPDTLISINAHVLPAKEYILIEVKDNGVGVSQDQQKRLFQRPYAHDKFDRRRTGLGLGLFLCQQIITAHSGELGIESSTDSGAAFWFTLPLAQANEANISPPEQSVSLPERLDKTA